jgi:UDP-3-O-[3-hydroxymyristoyl] N-acetylglucosamine deacetylase
MPGRQQRTLAAAAEIQGIGFFNGADVRVRFLPAAPHFGLVFQRVDCPGQPMIPALLDHVVPQHRRTVLAINDVSVELTEHVLAALAGLHIDNCLIQLDAPELPGVDGSSLPFAQVLLEAGIVEQAALRPTLTIQQPCQIDQDGTAGVLTATPVHRHGLVITYDLDYGPRSPIRPQTFTLEITPEWFITQLAFARTFVLEQEVAALRAAGYGQRVTESDLLIFGQNGPIGNQVRCIDECVRHKVLDCLGDFALLGCDLHGHVRAYRTGHAQNHALCREVQRLHLVRHDEQRDRTPAIHTQVA